MKDKPPKGIRYLHTGPWPVYIGFTTCEKAFAAEMKRLKVTGINFLGSDRANATMHTLENRGTLCFIITAQPFQPRKVSKEVYAALIAHEAIHIIQAMQEELARGESLGSEAEAYLVQQIVQECLQDAWKSTKSRRTEPV